MSASNEQQSSKTTQCLLSSKHPSSSENMYRLYPIHDVEQNSIQSGFDALAHIISHHDVIIIDGYIGVFWEDFRKQLETFISDDTTWINMADAMLSKQNINQLVEPFLGGDDPIFGKRTTLSLIVFLMRTN